MGRDEVGLCDDRLECPSDAARSNSFVQVFQHELVCFTCPVLGIQQNVNATEPVCVPRPSVKKTSVDERSVLTLAVCRRIHQKVVPIRDGRGHHNPERQRG